MTHDRIRMAVAACTVAMTMDAALGLGSRAALAQCQYEVTEVEPFPCQSWSLYGYTGHGLNNLGAWCGYREMCGGGAGDLPIYCPPGGTPQVLPMPPNAGPKGAQARAVNDSGIVVGVSFQGTSGRLQIGCIWLPDGSVTEIAPFQGSTSSAARAINNGGTIVGISGVNPYVLNDGVMTSIPVPEGLGFGFAVAVSDAGYVVGTFGNTNQNGRAFRWKDGALTLLQPVNGHPVSSARGVNNLGWVVGICQTQVTGPPWYYATPALWIGTAGVALPAPPGYTTGYASSVNDQGVITGYFLSNGPGFPATGVVWINMQVYKTIELVAPGSPSAGEMIEINEVGQMLGAGSARIMSPMNSRAADLNGDCAVDGADIAKVLSEWGPREWSVADIDGDGIVNGRDLGLVLGAWTGSAAGR